MLHMRLLLFAAVLAAQPRWIQSGGPEGGFMGGLAVNARGHVFVGSDGGGMFRSTDGGETWEQINRGLTNRSSSALVAMPGGRLFAGTLGRGNFVSGDNGDTWTPINRGMDTQFVLYVFQSRNGDFWSGTFGAGVFHSTDGGSTWTQKNNGLRNLVVYFFIELSAPGAFLIGTQGGIFKTTDNGVTWMPSGLNANPVLTGTAFARIGDGIAASTNGGVFRTNDEGATWTNISPGLPSTNVFVLARDSDDTLYAATLSGGMARYTEPAGRWTAINNGLPSPSVWSLAVGPAGEVYAGTAEALARSDDRGATWRLLKRGMIATRMQTLAQAWDGAIYAGSVNNGLARSDDGGRTWTEINQGLPGRSVRVLAVNYAGHVYTGFPGVGIFRSRDQGLEWRRTNEGLPAQPNVAALLALPDSGTMLAALTNGGVYRSRDFGDSWQPSNRGLVEERASTLARGTNGDLFVFSGNRVFGSNNEGASWLGLGATAASAAAISGRPRPRLPSGRQPRGPIQVGRWRGGLGARPGTGGRGHLCSVPGIERRSAVGDGPRPVSLSAGLAALAVVERRHGEPVRQRGDRTARRQACARHLRKRRVSRTPRLIFRPKPALQHVGEDPLANHGRDGEPIVAGMEPYQPGQLRGGKRIARDRGPVQGDPHDPGFVAGGGCLVHAHKMELAVLRVRDLFAEFAPQAFEIGFAGLALASGQDQKPGAGSLAAEENFAIPGGKQPYFVDHWSIGKS